MVGKWWGGGKNSTANSKILVHLTPNTKSTHSQEQIESKTVNKN
jgi:hypothetical protein